MLGEEEALPFSLFLQRQRPQSPTGDLALLTHGHLDERPFMWEQKGLCKWRRKGKYNRKWKIVKDKQKYRKKYG